MMHNYSVTVTWHTFWKCHIKLHIQLRRLACLVLVVATHICKCSQNCCHLQYWWNSHDQQEQVLSSLKKLLHGFSTFSTSFLTPGQDPHQTCTLCLLWIIKHKNSWLFLIYFFFFTIQSLDFLGFNMAFLVLGNDKNYGINNFLFLPCNHWTLLEFTWFSWWLQKLWHQ